MSWDGVLTSHFPARVLSVGTVGEGGVSGVSHVPVLDGLGNPEGSGRFIPEMKGPTLSSRPPGPDRDRFRTSEGRGSHPGGSSRTFLSRD